MKQTRTYTVLAPEGGSGPYRRKTISRKEAIKTLSICGAGAGVEVDGIPVGSVQDLRRVCRQVAGSRQ